MALLVTEKDSILIKQGSDVHSFSMKLLDTKRKSFIIFILGIHCTIVYLKSAFMYVNVF